MDPMTAELPRARDTDVTRPVPRAPRRLGGYDLLERLGEGGMGVVWRSVDLHGRPVAVKVLREHIAHDQQARERLRREVHTLARVHHPRVAAVIDADVDGPAPYIVTEHVDGPPLDQVVDRHGPLRGEALLRLGRGLGEALHAIHAAGIVHRDLKPGNVLMVGDDPVVIDFGIAQVADDVRLTMTGMVMGTPGYLSPEVVEGGQVGEATDWWGWAATLGYAASGQPPFGRGPLTVVLDRVLRGRLHLDGVDPELRPLLAAALDPDPARRPSEAQVLDGLERYARREDVTGALPVWMAEPARQRAEETRVHEATPVTRVAPQRRPDPTRVAWNRPAEPRPPHSDPPPYERTLTRRPDPQHERAPAPASFAEVGEQTGADTAYPDLVPDPRPGERGGPDPRIGRSARSGTLATLLVLLVGLAAVAPVLAWAVFGVWGVLTRTVDRTVTGLVLRRHEAGRRRSDVPVAALSSPWHLVAAAVTTVFALVLPVGVAGLTALAVAWGGEVSGMLPGLTPDHPLAMGSAALVGALVGWWGLASTSLRRGSRTTLRTLVPSGLPTTVVAVLCGVGGAALAVWGALELGVVSWWPLGPDFDPRQWLPGGLPF